MRSALTLLPGAPAARTAGLRLTSPPLSGLKLGSSGRTVTVTADSTIHTKGAWQEVVASNTEETSWLSINIGGMATTNTATLGLLDIGVGAAAAETAVISNLYAGHSSSAETTMLNYLLPIRIAAGARISARLQALISSDTCTVSIYCFSTPGMPTFSPTSLVTIGADTATSGSAVAMSSSNTYAQVTASTPQAFQAVIATIACTGGAGATMNGDATEAMTLGIGASGSEVTAAVGGLSNWTTTEQILPVSTGYAGHTQAFAAAHVPAGSRLATKITTGRGHKGSIIFGVPYS